MKTQLTTRQRIALANVGKYTSLALAQQQAISQKYWVEVLFGDNGQYWVAATNREQSILQQMGYEVVSRDTLSCI